VVPTVHRDGHEVRAACARDFGLQILTDNGELHRCLKRRCRFFSSPQTPDVRPDESHPIRQAATPVRSGLAAMRSNFALGVLARHRDGLGTRGDAELRQDRRDVMVDRFGRNKQAPRDGRITQTIG
jgi:hypothetical protein